jgi:hypothetical protein
MSDKANQLKALAPPNFLLLKSYRSLFIELDEDLSLSQSPQLLQAIKSSFSLAISRPAAIVPEPTTDIASG